MKCIARTSFAFAVIVLGLGFTFGCGKGATNDAPASPAAQSAEPATPSTEGIVRAATDFLDAVLKGDTQRASARLTPQAMQRIIASGKQFAPPGLETATFRIGRVRTPAKDHAFVECVLTDTSADGSPHSEEMCCALRFVDNDWRISGIAYATGPDQPWTLSNFETGQNMAVPRPSNTPGAPGQQNQVSRPSPPRMANEPAPVVR